MEAVHEFESQRNQKRDSEQRENPERQRFMGTLNVAQKTVSAIAKPRCQQQEEYDCGYRTCLLAQRGRAAAVKCFRRCRYVGHRDRSP